MTVLQFMLTASFTHCEDVFECLMQPGRFIRDKELPSVLHI